MFNSPWLDLQGSFFMRTAGTEAINRLGQRRPYAVIPRSVNGVYAETLHADLRGEWDLRPRAGSPARASRSAPAGCGPSGPGIASVHRGIDVGAPVLTLCSTRELAAAGLVR